MNAKGDSALHLKPTKLNTDTAVELTGSTSGTALFTSCATSTSR